MRVIYVYLTIIFMWNFILNSIYLELASESSLFYTFIYGNDKLHRFCLKSHYLYERKINIYALFYCRINILKLLAYVPQSILTIIVFGKGPPSPFFWRDIKLVPNENRSNLKTKSILITWFLLKNYYQFHSFQLKLLHSNIK